MVKYKKCIVPFCKASSRTCDKLFFGVPKQPQRRQDWLDAVGITLVLLGIKNSNSPIYVCEDHFEVLHIFFITIINTLVITAFIADILGKYCRGEESKRSPRKTFS